MWPGGRLAGLFTATGEDTRKLAPLAFAEVALPDAPDGQTPRLTTKLPGRNWVTLLKVIPGAIPTNGTALNGREYTSTGYADYRINGKNGSQTQVNLDFFEAEPTRHHSTEHLAEIVHVDPDLVVTTRTRTGAST